MKSRRGFFWRARPGWALVEGWLIGGGVLALIALVMRESSSYTTGQGILLAAVLASGWAGVRARFTSGKRLAVVMIEIAMGLLLAFGLTLIGTGLVAAFDVYQVLEQLNAGLAGVILPLASTSFLYWGVRVASLLARRWMRLVRSRFQWKLVNVILVIVSVIGIAGVLTLSLLSRSTMIKPEPLEGVSPLVPLLDVLVRTVFPYTAISLAAALAAAMVVLPPAFLVAYLVSRPLTRRLDGLVQAARRLRAGDWSARVERSGEDELAQLQEDFNAMAADLERATRDLQASRDQVTGLLKAQRELTAAVSHELHTPVATLRGYIENDLSQAESDLPEPYLRDLEVMHHEVLRLQGLIDDLFTLSRAEVGQLTLEMGEVDAGLIVKQVVAAARSTAWRAGKVDLAAEAGGELIVCADARRLEQALRNLIDNAVRYTPPGGIVAVQARAVGDEAVEISVMDTGVGIPAEDLPHIWERFYRAADGSGGAGLGLALVKELVEAMGGKVTVESQAGQGSRFTIRLNSYSR